MVYDSDSLPLKNKQIVSSEGFLPFGLTYNYTYGFKLESQYPYLFGTSALRGMNVGLPDFHFKERPTTIMADELALNQIVCRLGILHEA